MRGEEHVNAISLDGTATVKHGNRRVVIAWDDDPGAEGHIRGSRYELRAIRVDRSPTGRDAVSKLAAAPITRTVRCRRDQLLVEGLIHIGARGDVLWSHSRCRRGVFSGLKKMNSASQEERRPRQPEQQGGGDRDGGNLQRGDHIEAFFG